MAAPMGALPANGMAIRMDRPGLGTTRSDTVATGIEHGPQMCAAAARGVRMRRATPAKGSTRQRILDAALLLFNERGTPHVSTNHIAAAAGLSPGNLYYWFEDKQDVVRAVVGDWLCAVELQSQEAVDGPANVHSLWEDLSRTADVDWRYRFVGREALCLLHRDPELARSYRASYRRRLDAQIGYARRLVRAGVLREPLPPRSLEDLVLALWLIVQNWATHQSLVRDDSDPYRAASGIRPLMLVLGPHLTESGRRALEVL